MSATFTATCDACAHEGECQTVGDANVCEDCIGFHERAVTAAAAAGWRELSSTVQEYYGEERDRWRRLVAEMVKVYCEHDETPDPHDYPHCEPCAEGDHDHCSGIQPVGCCCEVPA